MPLNMHPDQFEGADHNSGVKSTLGISISDRFWFWVDHFFLFAGRRAVESTGPTGFCIIVYVGIKRPARAKKTNSPASFFVFRVMNVCGPVAGGGRRTVDDDDDSLFHLPPSP